MGGINLKLFAIGNGAIAVFCFIGILSFPLFYSPDIRKDDLANVGYRPEGVQFDKLTGSLSYAPLTEAELKEKKQADLIKRNAEIKEDKERENNRHNGTVLLLGIILALPLNVYIFRNTHFIKSELNEIREKFDHDKYMANSARNNEKLHAQKGNIEVDLEIKNSIAMNEIRIEAAKIENLGLRALVDRVVANNQMPSARYALMKKFIDSVNSEAITDKQAEMILKLLDRTASTDSSSFNDRMAEQELEKKIKENKIADQEIRKKTIEVDNYEEAEKLKKQGSGRVL